MIHSVTSTCIIRNVSETYWKFIRWMQNYIDISIITISVRYQNHIMELLEQYCDHFRILSEYLKMKFPKLKEAIINEDILKINNSFWENKKLRNKGGYYTPVKLKQYLVFISSFFTNCSWYYRLIEVISSISL